MRNIFTIYRRELIGYFNTPIAYIFLTVFVGLVSWFFHFYGFSFFLAGDADMRGFFGLMWAWQMIFSAAICMRIWSEELRVGTAEILMTLPYTVPQLVIGKFLAAYTVLALGLLLTLAVPIGVGYAGDPDWGPIITGYIGSLLMGGAFVALGCFVSSLTQNQVIALIIGLIGGVVLTFLFGPESAGKVGGLSKTFAEIVEGIGVRSHFVSFERGTIVLRDVAYFVTLAGFFLLLNVFRIESRRY